MKPNDESVNAGLELNGSRGVITSLDFDSMLEQSIGNMLNVIIFGMRYSEDNPVWNRIQKLRSDGIKELSVAGKFTAQCPNGYESR